MNLKSLISSLALVAFISQCISVTALAQSRPNGGQRGQQGSEQGGQRGDRGGSQEGRDRGGDRGGDRNDHRGGGRGDDRGQQGPSRNDNRGGRGQQNDHRGDHRPSQPSKPAKKSNALGAGLLLGALIGGLILSSQESSYQQPVATPPSQDFGREDVYESSPEVIAPSRGPDLLSTSELNATFTQYYLRATTDQQRLQMIADLAGDLERRNEHIDGLAVHTILSRLDGGQARTMSANRLQALQVLKNFVSPINDSHAAALNKLFPTKTLNAAKQAAVLIRQMQ